MDRAEEMQHVSSLIADLQRKHAEPSFAAQERQHKRLVLNRAIAYLERRVARPAGCPRAVALPVDPDAFKAVWTAWYGVVVGALQSQRALLAQQAQQADGEQQDQHAEHSQQADGELQTQQAQHAQQQQQAQQQVAQQQVAQQQQQAQQLVTQQARHAQMEEEEAEALEKEGVEGASRGAGTGSGNAAMLRRPRTTEDAGASGSRDASREGAAPELFHKGGSTSAPGSSAVDTGTQYTTGVGGDHGEQEVESPGQAQPPRPHQPHDLDLQPSAMQSRTGRVPPAGSMPAAGSSLGATGSLAATAGGLLTTTGSLAVIGNDLGFNVQKHVRVVPGVVHQPTPEEFATLETQFAAFSYGTQNGNLAQRSDLQRARAANPGGPVDGFMTEMGTNLQPWLRVNGFIIGGMHARANPGAVYTDVNNEIKQPQPPHDDNLHGKTKLVARNVVKVSAAPYTGFGMCHRKDATSATAHHLLVPSGAMVMMSPDAACGTVTLDAVEGVWRTNGKDLKTGNPKVLQHYPVPYEGTKSITWVFDVYGATSNSPAADLQSASLDAVSHFPDPVAIDPTAMELLRQPLVVATGQRSMPTWADTGAQGYAKAKTEAAMGRPVFQGALEPGTSQKVYDARLKLKQMVALCDEAKEEGDIEAALGFRDGAINARHEFDAAKAAAEAEESANQALHGGAGSRDQGGEGGGTRPGAGRKVGKVCAFCNVLRLLGNVIDEHDAVQCKSKPKPYPVAASTASNWLTRDLPKKEAFETEAAWHAALKKVLSKLGWKGEVHTKY